MTIIDAIKKGLKAAGVNEKYAAKVQKLFKIEKEEDIDTYVALFKDNILPDLEDTSAVEKAKKFHSARNMSYSQGNRMGKRSADCSSFCGRCYLPQGITMGGSTSWCNTAAGMALWSTKKGKVVANSGVSIGKKKLLPGDLVFYKKGYNGRYKNIYHVEIFVGYEWRNNQLVGYTMSSITGNYPSILKRDYTSRKGRVAQIARPAQ